MSANITSPTEKVVASRLWWVGPLAVIAVVRTAAVSVGMLTTLTREK